MKTQNKKRYYRNTIPLRGIDPGALWKRKGNVMILEDEDQYVRVKWDVGWFEESDDGGK